MSLKIVAISDTHSYHRSIKVPDGDILIHAGDITWRGEMDIIEDFANWMKGLPYKYKICIHGNHELGHEYGIKRQPGIDMLLDAGVTYLQDSGTEIEGLKIWGSAITPEFCNWEYNRKRGRDIAVHWKKIPDNTEILISHGPPYGILDQAPRGDGKFENVGCKDLLKRIDLISNLKLHVFGHIHRENNDPPIIRNGVKFVNAAILNDAYQMVNDPIIIEV